MRILVIGSRVKFKECCEKFGVDHQYSHVLNYETIDSENIDIAFDFIVDKKNATSFYRDFTGVAFIDSSHQALKVFENLTTKATLFGFCGLPTFLNRPVFEVSSNSLSIDLLQSTCEKLATPVAIVKDQVGLVTARVICMIINEAYFAVEQNIASRKDIDLAMKLGTNYPFGPFEWCERIGVVNVYGLLNAVYSDTGDPRYQACQLLEEEAKQPS